MSQAIVQYEMIKYWWPVWA